MARKPAPPGCDRRQQILDAALALFAEQGLEGATSKDIAERAEVTHGLIYFYFKSKEELFKAAFEYALELALDQLDLASLTASDDPPDQTLNRVLASLLETMTSPMMLSMSRLMMHTMAHKDWRAGPLHECKLQVNATVDLIVSEIREYLDRQVAQGRLRPVNTEIVAKFLVGGVVSSVRWAQADTRFASASHDTAQAITDAIVRGLLPASTAAPPATPTPREPSSARDALSLVGAHTPTDE